MDRLNLSELPQALNRAGYQAPRYHQLYRCVLDGALAEHVTREAGRWYVSAADLPKIAQTLGLTAKAAA